MKIGVRAHDFGRMEPEALAEIIAAAGFETVQLAPAKALSGIQEASSMDAAMLERIRRAFADNRVEIGILGCYVEIGETDKRARLQEVNKFLLGLAQAKELGAGLVGTETTSFSPDPAMQPMREAAYQGLKDSVLRMAERAEKLGVDIGIETVASHTLNTAEWTRRLLDEVGSPRLHVIFDPVNLLLTPEDIQNQEGIFHHFLESCAADIAALHMKDIALENGKQIWRGIGKGDICFKSIFSWLKAHGRDIPIFREEADPATSREDIEAMRQLCK